MTKLLRALAACLCVLVCATRAFAQQAPIDGRLLLTVTDPSGGVLPGATVTVVSLEPAAKTTAPTVVYANKDGVATVEHLAPGRYAAVVEMDAFEPVKIAEIRIRTGDNKRTQPLALLPSRRFFRCFLGTFNPCCRHSRQTRWRLTRQPSRRSKAQIRR